MTSLPASPRALARALAAATALLVLSAPAQAAEPEAANFDARPERAAEPAPHTEEARERLRDELGRFGTLSVDDRSGTVRAVGRLDGFLTGPSDRDGADVALGYVRDHAAAFGVGAADLDGLRLVDRSFAGGVEHLTWEQRHRGIPVADGGLQAAVTGAGRLLGVTGPPAADVALRSTEPEIGAAEAYAAALRSGGGSGAAVVAARPGDAERTARFDDGGRASLALYRGAGGMRLAWRVLAPVSSTGVYDVLVDARSGATVRRVNRVRFALAKVFEASPAQGPQVDFELPAAWLSASTALTGPSVHAFSDANDQVPLRTGSSTWSTTPASPADNVDPSAPGQIDQLLETVACAEPRTPDCSWVPGSAGSWAANREQSVTQLFYAVNVFADHLRTDPNILWTSRAFRRTGQPLGNPNAAADAAASDPVLAQALDGANVAGGLPDAAHRNNASFLALPDGIPGYLQMYLWSPEGGGPFGAYDGANDASMVFHEYAHGLSERLVTDAAGFGALSSAQAGAIGEGTSDFYALDLLVDRGLEPDDPDAADVRMGRSLDGGAADGIRFQPIDCVPVEADPDAACGADRGTGTPGMSRLGGLTYADFGDVLPGTPEIHADGEIWAQTLWDVRRSVGVARARRYVTRALELAPPEPTFLDMRNAIVQASVENGDDDALWSVFAARGMGYFAYAADGDDVAPVADFTDPATLTSTGAVGGQVVDDDGLPVAGASVGVAGFDTGLGPVYTDETDAGGAFAIGGVPTNGASVYPALRASKSGFQGAPLRDVPVPAAGLELRLLRDWSSAVFPGVRVASFTGEDNTALGCGPGGLIDDDPATVWGTSRADGGRELVVELAKPIDVGNVAVDPAAGCGDDRTASLGAFDVLGASALAGPYRPLATGAFGPLDIGRMNEAFAGDARGVRFLKLVARSPQSTAPGTDGASFVDVAELRVRKVPGSPIGAASVTGTATVVGFAGATVTGTVTPNGAPAQVVFEYGTTAQYGSAVVAGTTGAGDAPAGFAAALPGLQPSTEYHFRVVALRGDHRYEGGDATFTTKPAPVVQPPIATPTPTPTPTPVPPDEGPVISTAFTSKHLTASRKGMVKIRWVFGDAAPPGKARVRVLDTKRRRRALTSQALVAVQRGRRITKTLRLNRTGRRLVKPGRTRAVRLELRLPGGGKLAATAQLRRKRSR